MRPIPTVEQCGITVGRYGLDGDGYDCIAKQLGDVIHETRIGDYVGDYLYLLADDARRGFLVQGYGSCSGCDAWEACLSAKDAQDLIEYMYNSVHWEDSPDAMFRWIRDRDWKGQWTWHEEETCTFLSECAALLRGWTLEAWRACPYKVDWLLNNELPLFAENLS